MWSFCWAGRRRVFCGRMGLLPGWPCARARRRGTPGARGGRRVYRCGAAAGTGPFSNQVELNQEGYFAAGEDCRTKLPGVFVAGDSRAKAVRQLTTAVGDGAVAGLAAARYVEDLEG